MHPKLVVCLTLAVASAWAAHAQSPTRTFTVENDLFAGTDRHYTNGLRYSAVRADVGETPWWGREIARELGVCGDDTPQGNIAETCFQVDRGFSITHTIYSPADISIAVPIPGDRPYGGWFHYTTMFDLHNRRRGRHHHFEADFGVTGDWSLAEDIQTEWHNRVINVEPPMGWDSNQIDDSLTFLLLYRYRRVLIEKLNADEDLRFFDLSPHAVGTFGNVFTYAGAGATARLGYNIPPEFTDVIEPAAAGSPGERPWRVFVFAGAEGRFVARNMFLDGNETNGPSVNKKPFVSDLSAGLAVGYKRLLVSYRLVRRSREFEGQLEPQDFASIVVTWRPRA